MSHLFRWCDPEMSFAPGSSGEQAKRIVGSWGASSFNDDVWELGRAAYSHLRMPDGANPTTAQLVAAVEREKSWLDQFFANEIATAPISVVSREDGSVFDLNRDWSDSRFAWQVRTIIDLFDQIEEWRATTIPNETLPRSPSNDIEAFGGILLLATLVALDEASVMSRDGIGDGAVSALLDATFFLGRYQALRMVQSQLEGRGMAAIAKKAAGARHAENHAMKDQVFAWLSQHRSKYQSMDAAAEAIAGRIAPVKFRTARSWVGDWHKGANRHGR